MLEDDTTGVSYVRTSLLDEPRWRTRVLFLVTIASASLTANVLAGFYLMRGGVR
jgi:hypothetical protein